MEPDIFKMEWLLELFDSAESCEEVERILSASREGSGSDNSGGSDGVGA